MKYGFLLLFLASTAMSADFPEGAKIEFIDDFSGGLNTAAPGNKIPKGFFPEARNIFMHRNPGKVIKRNGFVQAGITTVTITSGRFMFTYNKDDGSKEFIVSDDSVVLTTQDFNTYVLISSALNNALHLQAAQVRDKVWFTNGTDSVFTWDGTVMRKLDGTSGTPNVPKFRYIAFYQERVFGLNTTANRSSLDWSDVASTAGVAIAPDSYLAWPATNRLSVGQGDGQKGTALWVFSGQLQIGKENSIYTLFGTNTASYNARKTVADAGPSSQDSVVILDDFTYFKGYNGIYAYDGGKAIRISDAINPNINEMQDDSTQIVSDIWETQSEFATKGQFYGSTATADGFLTPSVKTWGPLVNLGEDVDNLIYPSGVLGAIDAAVALTPGTSFFGPVQLTFNASDMDRNAKVLVRKIDFTTTQDPGCDLIFASVTITNNRTGITEKSDARYKSGAASILQAHFSTSSQATPVFDGYDILNSTLGFKVEGCGFTIISALSASAGIKFINSTTAQYVSQITTITTITSWSNFDSLRNTNGGEIDYFLRTATSVINMSTQVWQAFTPGVVIPFPITNKYIQFASTIASVSTYSVNIANIDNVLISHILGAGSKDRAFAISWKNEYWLSVATETSGLFSLQYVKSWITNPTPHAWVIMNGMNLRSFTKDGSSTLYGGSASTGAFYRLDYGTNDNGLAIEAHYETPDLALNKNWMEQYLAEIWLDVDGETGNTFKSGLSLNGGTYTDTDVDVSGTGRQLEVLNLGKGKFAKYFRLRAKNVQLDKSMGLNNMAVVYKDLNTR